MQLRTYPRRCSCVAGWALKGPCATPGTQGGGATAQQQQQGARDSQRGVREGVPHCTRRGYWTYAMYDGEPPLLATIEYINKEPGHGDGITLLHRELQSLATATSERLSVSWFV